MWIYHLFHLHHSSRWRRGRIGGYLYSGVWARLHIYYLDKFCYFKTKLEHFLSFHMRLVCSNVLQTTAKKKKLGISGGLGNLSLTIQYNCTFLYKDIMTKRELGLFSSSCPLFLPSLIKNPRFSKASNKAQFVMMCKFWHARQSGFSFLPTL